jgi:outer membrane protein TolC
MITTQRRAIAGSSALLLLGLVLAAGSLRAQTTNALTLSDCLRESLHANHTLLARSAEREAAGARAKGSTAARLPRLFAIGSAQHTTDPYRLQAATENNQPASSRGTLGRRRLEFHFPFTRADGSPPNKTPRVCWPRPLRAISRLPGKRWRCGW